MNTNNHANECQQPLQAQQTDATNTSTNVNNNHVKHNIPTQQTLQGQQPRQAQQSDATNTQMNANNHVNECQQVTTPNTTNWCSKHVNEFQQPRQAQQTDALNTPINANNQTQQTDQKSCELI